MGVYIKGMEMPKNCDNCWALDDYGDYPRCRITEEQRGYNFPIREKRMDNCPLVEIPPHGRLGDLDALAKIVLNWITTQEKAYPNEDSNALSWRLGARAMGHQIYRDIEAAPTIIPAEEGE